MAAPRLAPTTSLVALFAAACGGAVTGGTPTAPTLTRPPAVTPSEQLARLVALGLDPAHLPELADVPVAATNQLMETFDDSLDACCEDCHVKGDLRAPTRAKRVSAAMWRHFNRELTLSDGGPVYCDSCHDGSLRFLDRRDPAALGEWMRQNYVAKLRNRDGSPVGCPTCHGEPFDPKVLDHRWLANGGAE